MGTVPAAMISLSMRLPCEMEFMGQSYKLNTAFDAVLRVFALQKDELFLPVQRVAIGAEILGGRQAARLELNNQIQFLEAAIAFLVGKQEATQEPRALDFEQDAPYIYAAFMEAYGLDLHKLCGCVGIGPWRRARLDWRQFTALFMGLPDNIKIKEIISIRRRPVPAPTKHNGPEIKALMEAKTFYALRLTEAEAEAQFQRGVDRLAAALEARASKPQ